MLGQGMTHLDTTIDVLEDFNLLVPDQVAPVPDTQAYCMHFLASLTSRTILPHFLLDWTLLQVDFQCNL